MLKCCAQRSHKISRIQKITYFTNRSWYFNKSNTFSSFEEEIISSIQFNGKMMLSTKFLQTLTSRYLTLFWRSQYNKLFFFNYVFKSPFFFSYLDIIKICFNKFLFFKLSETFCICLFSVLSQCYDWWNELVSVMVDGKWYIFRYICLFKWSSFVCCIDGCPMLIDTLLLVFSLQWFGNFSLNIVIQIQFFIQIKFLQIINVETDLWVKWFCHFP